ncbi:MAG: hypothetical protein AB1553_09475 [Nitrospirota bacterium]
MKHCFIVLSMLLLAFTLTGCNSLMKRDRMQTVTIETVVHPHEECMEMTPGDMLSYSFTASGPFDFNIHYHEGKDIFYPVSQKAVSSGEGSYTAERAHIYCLMWTNTRQEPLSLTYTFRVDKPERK